MPNLDGFEAALAIRALEAASNRGAGNVVGSTGGEHGDVVLPRPTKLRRLASNHSATGAGCHRW